MAGSSQGNPRPDSEPRTNLRVGDNKQDTFHSASDATSVWRQLAPMVAAVQSMRLWNPTTRRYADKAQPRLTTRSLPIAPAAVPIYRRGGTTTLLVLDFDAKPFGADGLAMVAQDVATAVEWIRAAGGVVVVDHSPTSGGMHVLVPLSESAPMRREHLEPLLQLLETRLPTLDCKPMRSKPGYACITPPGSPCKDGGYRQLVDATVDDAVDAFTVRSEPGVIRRMIETLHPQQALPLAGAPGETERAGRTDPPAVEIVALETTLPPAHISRAALPGWVANFVQHGVVPDKRTPDGKPWSASEARLAVIEHHALRGWSGQQIWDTMRAQWPGMWAAYVDRKDQVRRFSDQWELGYDHAWHRSLRKAGKSHSSVHQLGLTHTGGIRDLRWKLAAARKWVLISGEFDGRERWTALAVVNALAYAIALTPGTTAAMGGRWLSISGGMVSEDAVWAVLRKIRSVEGSPVRFVRGFDSEHGDEYTLVEPTIGGRKIRAAEWEVYATRVDPIDPVWSVIGRSAWHVWETMRAIEQKPGARLTRRVIAAAGRIAVTTVDAAVAALEEHGLVDVGHGWAARTGRTTRRLGELTEWADTRRQERIERHGRERHAWKVFTGIIRDVFGSPSHSQATGVHGKHEIEDPAYLATVLSHGAPAPPDPGIPLEEALEDAIDLIEIELGGILLADADPATSR